MKVVISGGSYAGKTTVVELMGRLGHPTVSEAGQEVTDELISKMGIMSMNDFRKKNPYQFLEMISKRQNLLEQRSDKSRSRPLVMDRSIYDYVAYLKILKIRTPTHIKNMLGEKFDRVFILETLKNYKTRPETGRTLDKDFSHQWRDACTYIYNQYGMKPIFVEQMTIDKRLDLIRENL